MPTPAEIQSLIDNTTSSTDYLDILITSKCVEANIVHRTNFVKTIADLPRLDQFQLDPGTIVFVDEIKTLAINTGNKWTTLNGRDTIRLDFNRRELYGWGSNYCGILAINCTGESVATRSPQQEISGDTIWSSVSPAYSSAAGLKTNGSIWTWGNGATGRLGNGNTTNFLSPIREFCSANDWRSVSMFSETTMALKTNGSIWGWGSNSCCILGNPNIGASTCSPIREVCSATDWCSVSVGQGHTLALKTNNTLWAWGNNASGEIGDGLTTTFPGSVCTPKREICSATNWSQISAGGSMSMALKTDGSLWSWGYNGKGQLGIGSTTSICSPVREFCSANNWCQISSGNTFSAAVKTDGSLWSWGCQQYGRLGNGQTGSGVNISSPIREICSATNWCLVSAGNRNGLGVKTDGTLWVWGIGATGELGNGTICFGGCGNPIRVTSPAATWVFAASGKRFSGSMFAITSSS